MEKVTIIYSLSRVDGAYPRLRIRIQTADPVDTATRLAGTVDNRDGYGDPTSAARVGRQLADLLTDGHRRFFEPCYGDGADLTMEYQEFKSGPHGDGDAYCRPCVNAGSSYTKIAAGMALLERLGKSCQRAENAEYKRRSGYDCGMHPVSESDLRSPAALIAALDRAGAVRVKSLDRTDHPTWPDYTSYQVPDKSPRISFLGENAVKVAA